jgi:Zn-dependent peptidase ImmA (M78 family)
MRNLSLSNSEIEQQAEVFLNKYHPLQSLPVPIEEIIEFQLGFHIIPTPGLMRKAGVDAVTLQDLNRIHIDSKQLSEYANRSRFTLAHEIGHCLLHRGLSKDIIRRDLLEVQANAFAAALLMPERLVKKELAIKQKNFQNRWNKQGKEMKSKAELQTAVMRSLARQFQVSEEAMTLRLRQLVGKGKTNGR